MYSTEYISRYFISNCAALRNELVKPQIFLLEKPLRRALLGFPQFTAGAEMADGMRHDKMG